MIQLHEEISFIPEYFDSAEKWPQCTDTIDEVHDQGGCGTVVEGQAAKTSIHFRVVLGDCRRNIDNGSNLHCHERNAKEEGIRAGFA